MARYYFASSTGEVGTGRERNKRDGARDRDRQGRSKKGKTRKNRQSYKYTQEDRKGSETRVGCITSPTPSSTPSVQRKREAEGGTTSQSFVRSRFSAVPRSQSELCVVMTA